jgi:hypothetical protein
MTGMTPGAPVAVSDAVRRRVAWLMWCFEHGYVNAEDRSVLTNWLEEDPATLHPADAGRRPHLLAMADEVIAAVHDEAKPDLMWERDKALGTKEEDGAGGGIAADVHLLAAQRDQARTQLAIAVAALRWVLEGCNAGEFAHDTAHSALDEIGAVTIPDATEADKLRERLTVTRERLENLAAGLELSATRTAPSKKSQIEQECATAVRDIAQSIGAQS